jgi:cysteinyl-tRNA synthetase
LNSPQAISRLHELASEYNKGNKNAGQLLKSSAKILGLLNYDTSKWFTKDVRDDENEINNLIAERDKARSDKNFKLADEIRDKLKEMGVSIEDSNSGTKWRVD